MYENKMLPISICIQVIYDTNLHIPVLFTIYMYTKHKQKAYIQKMVYQ